MEVFKNGRIVKTRPGIYKIFNTINNKFYIGGSLKVNKRISAHVCMLNNNYHPNIKLQKDFNKYGKQNFKFEIIEYCEKENLIEKEQFYINKYKIYKNGYNICRKADSSLGFRHSEKTKITISKKLKGKMAGNKNPMYGKKHSEESKDKNRQAHLGKRHTEEWKKKMSERISGKNHPMFGKHHTKEAKKKISEIHKGKKLSEEHQQKLKIGRDKYIQEVKELRYANSI